MSERPSKKELDAAHKELAEADVELTKTDQAMRDAVGRKNELDSEAKDAEAERNAIAVAKARGAKAPKAKCRTREAIGVDQRDQDALVEALRLQKAKDVERVEAAQHALNILLAQQAADEALKAKAHVDDLKKQLAKAKAGLPGVDHRVNLAKRTADNSDITCPVTSRRGTPSELAALAYDKLAAVDPVALADLLEEWKDLGGGLRVTLGCIYWVRADGRLLTKASDILSTSSTADGQSAVDSKGTTTRGYKLDEPAKCRELAGAHGLAA